LLTVFVSVVLATTSDDSPPNAVIVLAVLTGILLIGCVVAMVYIIYTRRRKIPTGV